MSPLVTIYKNWPAAKLSDLLNVSLWGRDSAKTPIQQIGHEREEDDFQNESWCEGIRMVLKKIACPEGVWEESKITVRTEMEKRGRYLFGLRRVYYKRKEDF